MTVDTIVGIVALLVAIGLALGVVLSLEREPDEPASLAPFLTWLLAAFVAGIAVAFLAQRLVQS